MDNQAIKDALLAANTELVEKIGKQPYFGLKLILDDVFGQSAARIQTATCATEYKVRAATLWKMLCPASWIRSAP